jgi:hypothetical protein
MSFEVAPHILDWIEFGRVGGEAFDDHALAGGGDVILDQQTAMDRRPIPKNQNPARDMPLQVLEKFDDLWAFDAAFMDLKVKPPQGQPANDREAFPVEGFVQDGRLPARSPGANTRWASAQPTFIDEDDGSPLAAGFFLRRAIPLVASGEWPARRAPPPDAPVAGS